MPLFNKLCEYLENEKGLKEGFVCTITGEHVSSSDEIYKDYCDTYTRHEKCPFHPANQ